jgi:hypothetical protein
MEYSDYETFSRFNDPIKRCCQGIVHEIQLQFFLGIPQENPVEINENINLKIQKQNQQTIP